MKKIITATALLLAFLFLCSCYAADGNYAAPEMVLPSVYDGENPVIENKFIKTTENAVSTFSADVDTASYTYFRKMVNAGYDLSELKEYVGASVRTEEMINYFDYGYLGPDDGELFGVNTFLSVCPWNPDDLLLTVGLRSTDAVKAEGNNLVFLIDVSGSMNSRDKLDLLKKSFSVLTATLTERDVVSIVTYAGKEEVVLDGCSGSKTAKIGRAIDGLRASGSTNGQAGIVKAYDIAKKHFIEGGNNRIIMASDGDLNVGISDPEELRDFISEKRDDGIYLSVLGFGTGNYRDASMEALADHGNGAYYYIDGEVEAERIFGEKLTGTLYTVANDVKLQISFNEETVGEYRLIGYENRVMDNDDFKDDTKDAGEVGASHSVTVCYELKPAGDMTAAGLLENIIGQDGAQTRIADLAVRWKNPGESQSDEKTYALDSSSIKAGTDDQKLVSAIIELAMLLHNSKYAKELSINDVLDLVNSINTTNEYKIEFRDMIRKLAQ